MSHASSLRVVIHRSFKYILEQSRYAHHIQLVQVVVDRQVEAPQAAVSKIKILSGTRSKRFREDTN